MHQGSVQMAETYPENPVRQRIVKAARTYFMAHGFRSVTMADLAKGLGMSKKTLYVHFASKDELLEAAVQDKFCEGERDLERITACTVDNFLIGVQELLS